MPKRLLLSVSLLAALLSGRPAAAQVSCSGLPAFATCTGYAAGTSVVFNNTKYTSLVAIPATRDCPPAPYNPSNDNWWTANGACSTGPTATPRPRPATPTATATATPTTIVPTPRPTGALPRWALNTLYPAGTLVTYNGNTYRAYA